MTSKTQNRARRSQAGFSMVELLISSVVLLAIAGITMSGLKQMSMTQGTVSNRTDMHAAVRGATELLQQEIGQAGRIAMPTQSITLAAAITATGSQTVALSPSGAASGMFANQQVVVDVGDNGGSPPVPLEETVTLTAVNTTTNSITAVFGSTHATGAPVLIEGAFASGIVPTTATNGSTGWVLKLYGDLNDDGNMQYVEYTCGSATGPSASGSSLYRNAMSVAAASKPALTASMVLLPNVIPNPSGAACFTYQQKTVGSDTYVVNVAVTLTVQTGAVDPQTGQYQQETKALLNVSPRNVFQGWQFASGGVADRIQPMPASISTLLP